MTDSTNLNKVIDFLWQYEFRRQWHNFSDEEMQSLNEAVNDNHNALSFISKKKKAPVTVDFNNMVMKNDKTKYEQRVRCLVCNSDFYIWERKSDKNEWICYSPITAFLLEVAFQKKEVKVNVSNLEFNLLDLKEVSTETGESTSVQRINVPLKFTDEIHKIFQKNKLIFQDTVTKEFTSIKRSIDAIYTIDQNGSIPKKKRLKKPVSTDTQTVILPDNTMEIEDTLGVMKSSKVTTSSNVPVDKECPIKSEFDVYFEVVPFSATLNQTNLQNNNNKFYFIQLLKQRDRNQYAVWRRWGRVGNKGQTSLNKYGTNLSDAKEEFDKKFYDKTRNHWNEANSFVHVKGKYDLLQINLNPEPKKPLKIEVESKLNMDLKALMELICDTQRMEDIMKEMSYDSNKTPLGELTLSQVKSGYIALNKIAVILKRGGNHSELLNACNEFYTKIPHNFGMKTPPIIKTQSDLNDKQVLLEALSNIQVAMNVMNSNKGTLEHPLDKYYRSLNCSLELVEPGSSEYLAVEKCLQETHGPTHSAYKMEIITIFKCFKSQKGTSVSPLSNKFILWHGSRIINWIGILKEGLRIAPPEAPRTGYMFGKGIYFADVSSKSANYCYATRNKNEGLLLMCEVSVGKQHIMYDADEEMPDSLPSDCNSVFAKGKVSPTDYQTSVLSSEAKIPVGPLIENPDHEGYLHYNEYIVYNTKQVQMKYLVRIKFNFK